MSGEGRPPGRLRGNLVAVASAAVWASAFPATDVLLRDWSPLPLAAARLTLAALATLAVLAALGRSRELARLRWGDALLFGGLGVGGSVGLLVAGQALSGGVAAAIVASMTPAFAAALDAAAGERQGPARLAAVALAVAGGAVATVGPGAASGGGFGVDPGVFLLVGSGVVWTWASRGLGRLAATGASDLARSCAGLAAGALVLALASAAAGIAGLAPVRWSLEPGVLPFLLWMGVVGVGLSFPLWLAAVRMLGLTVAALHNNLAPFYVILFVALAGQGVGTRELLGGALVVLAAVLAQLPARREPGGAN